MESRLKSFVQAYEKFQGSNVAKTFDPLVSFKSTLEKFSQSTNHYAARSDINNCLQSSSYSTFSPVESNAWVEVIVSFWEASGLIVSAEAEERKSKRQVAQSVNVFAAWKEFASQLIRGYTQADFPAFTVPCLYVAGKYLRIFAIKADSYTQEHGSQTDIGLEDDIMEDSKKDEYLKDAARVINRIFQICISDRASLEESRKWGIYYASNLLFKTYFRLNSITLCKNIIRALGATHTDLPPLSAFPKSHQVTFKYYLGVLHFLEEDYQSAQTNLTEAYSMCPLSATRNLELILTYLIPCHLLTDYTLPTASLLAPFPTLQKRFGPLSNCIKRGNLAGFDEALAKGEAEFVRRRIYLTLERGRDIALRNLCRKVYLEGGWETNAEGEKIRRTRIPVSEFGVAIGLGQTGGKQQKKGSKEMQNDEVECLLANLIYKNLLKGYISRERSIVVLSKGKGGAFPGTGI